jgi:hypothetical protein
MKEMWMVCLMAFVAGVMVTVLVGRNISRPEIPVEQPRVRYIEAKVNIDSLEKVWLATHGRREPVRNAVQGGPIGPLYSEGGGGSVTPDSIDVYDASDTSVVRVAVTVIDSTDTLETSGEVTVYSGISFTGEPVNMFSRFGLKFGSMTVRVPTIVRDRVVVAPVPFFKGVFAQGGIRSTWQDGQKELYGGGGVTLQTADFQMDVKPLMWRGGKSGWELEGQWYFW